MYIPIILGTARYNSRSEKIAAFVLGEGKEKFETELIKVGDFLQRYSAQGAEGLDSVGEKLGKADGFVIVSPEYNHGYPGELKLFLDYFYKEFNRKPLAICGVGDILGGGRMVEQLRLVAIELQMVPIRNAVYFRQVETLFDDGGGLKDPAIYRERLYSMFEELTWYAKALKEARES